MPDFATGTYVMAVIIALVSGGIVMGVLRWRQSEYKIVPKEFLIGTALIVLVTTPLVNFVGGKIAQASAVGGYVEFWNGSIIAAKSKEITCTRDGSCAHEYRCDPYDVWEIVRYETEYYTDSKGNRQSRQKPVYGWVTHYHQCPYASHEYNYWLEDSFGQEHTIASHIFAAEPRPWRGGTAVLGGVDRGAPEEWSEADRLIKAGNAPPATKTSEYVNYLLAAEGSNLRAYSDDIERYREDGLLPTHTQNHTSPIFGGYQAKKFVTTGGLSVDEAAWQSTLAHLNAKLGMTLQGDLHVLALPADRVDNPDAYANALLAYWQSDEFGKNSLAKNAIMLVVGVDASGQRVVWARAKSGLPVGNGEMLTAISLQLDGDPFEPAALLGAPSATIVDGEPTYSFSGGEVDRIMTRDHPFQRPCMECEDEGESGGFVYLKAEAFIGFWPQFWIVFVGVVVAGALWALFAWLPLFEPVHRRLGASRTRRSYHY